MALAEPGRDQEAEQQAAREAYGRITERLASRESP